MVYLQVTCKNCHWGKFATLGTNDGSYSTGIPENCHIIPEKPRKTPTVKTALKLNLKIQRMSMWIIRGKIAKMSYFVSKQRNAAIL